MVATRLRCMLSKVTRRAFNSEISELDSSWMFRPQHQSIAFSSFALLRQIPPGQHLAEEARTCVEGRGFTEQLTFGFVG